MKKPNVVFVGNVVIDHNKVEQAHYVRWGSPAMFMTKYFQAKFDIEPTIIASYGADFLPYAEGVALIPKQPNLDNSVVYENIVAGGHRTQYCRHADVRPPEINSHVQMTLAGADILFLVPLTPHFPAAYVAEFMNFIPPACLKVLSPQGYLRQIGDDNLVRPRDFTEAANILPHFDVAILSDEDHPQAESAAHDWKHASRDTEIIVTQNARGAEVIQMQGVKHVPTVPVPPEKIIDSVGCGDIFSAALAYHLYSGEELTAAIQAAHAAAREKLLTPPRP